MEFQKIFKNPTNYPKFILVLNYGFPLRRSIQRINKRARQYKRGEKKHSKEIYCIKGQRAKPSKTRNEVN